MKKLTVLLLFLATSLLAGDPGPFQGSWTEVSGGPNVIAVHDSGSVDVTLPDGSIVTGTGEFSQGTLGPKLIITFPGQTFFIKLWFLSGVADDTQYCKATYVDLNSGSQQESRQMTKTSS